MRDYGKVNGQFWTGKTGKALRVDAQAQIVAMYLVTSPDVTYTRQQLVGVAELPINSICGRVRSLLDKDALVVRGELRCANTGKYRELLGLPKEGCA